MALPILRLDQGDTGTPGQSRSNLVISTVINITDTVPGNAAGPHVTELVGKPTSSAATIVNPTSLTAQLTMDVPGAYLIKRTFNNDPLQVSYIIAASIENPNGWRYPAPGERTEFGTAGWHPALEEILDILQYGVFYIDGSGNASSLAMVATSIWIDEAFATLGSNELHLQMAKGSAAAPVSLAGGKGRIRYNESLERFEVSTGATPAWTELGAGGGGGGGNTLDGAYDEGGSGAGRQINADTDAVVITGIADANNVLEVTKPGGTGDALEVSNAGAGRAINIPAGEVVLGTTTGMEFPSQISIGVPSNPGLTIRDTTLGIEIEVFCGNTSGTAAGQIGTNTAHPLEFYTDEFVRWRMQVSGDFESEFTGQAVRASVLDISQQPTTTPNENHIVGAGGSAAAVSAANTGRIRYNESTNKWQFSENAAAYQDFGSGGGGAATALATTGGDVSVNTAGQPTAGQALIADSDSVATWQDLPAAAGSIADARGSYIFVPITPLQSTPSNGSPFLLYDSPIAERGDITLVSGQFSLKAGRTYRLVGQVRPESTQIYRCGFYDVTNAVEIGSESQQGDVESHPAFAIITPETNILVEFRINSGSGGTTQNVINAPYPVNWVEIFEIGAVTTSVSGGLEFMDEIVVTSAQTTVSFGVGGDGLFQRALDGNVDEEYVLDGTIVPAIDTNTDYSLRPNGIALNQKAQYLLGQSGPASGDITYLFLSQYLASFTPASTTLSFDASLSAKTGVPRKFRNQHGLIDTDTGVTDGRLFVVSGSWNDISTNITTLDIVSSLASNIGPGSRIRLFRRVSRNLRADSANVTERTLTAAVAPGTASPGDEYTLGHTIVSGSIIGMSVRLEEAVLSGSVVVTLKLDGTDIGSVTINTSNPTSNRIVFPFGQNPYVADQNISAEIEALSYGNALSNTSGITVVVMLQTDAYLQSPGGGLQHVRTIKVTSADKNEVTFPAVDLSSSSDLVLESRLIPAASATQLRLDTGSIVGDSYYFQQVGGGNPVGGAASSVVLLGNIIAAAERMTSRLQIFGEGGALGDYNSGIEGGSSIHGRTSSPNILFVKYADQLVVNGNFSADGPQASSPASIVTGWIEQTDQWYTTGSGAIDGLTVRPIAGTAQSGELRQDIDVSSYSADIDASLAVFVFSGYGQVFNQTPADATRFLVEARDNVDALISNIYDSGNFSSKSVWLGKFDRSPIPPLTRKIRVRLLSTFGGTGSNVDSYFSNVSGEIIVGQSTLKTLTVITDVTDGIGVGSEFRLYRLTETSGKVEEV